MSVNIFSVFKTNLTCWLSLKSGCIKLEVNEGILPVWHHQDTNFSTILEVPRVGKCLTIKIYPHSTEYSSFQHMEILLTHFQTATMNWLLSFIVHRHHLNTTSRWKLSLMHLFFKFLNYALTNKGWLFMLGDFSIESLTRQKLIRCFRLMISINICWLSNSEKQWRHWLSYDQKTFSRTFQSLICSSFFINW